MITFPLIIGFVFMTKCAEVLASVHANSLCIKSMLKIMFHDEHTLLLLRLYKVYK